MKLINLDENVIQALDFYIKNPPPKVNLSKFKLPFVIGSGNAINTGMILFSGRAAIFCDESNFKQTIAAYKPVIEKKLIDSALVISASGEKDSVWEVELAKKYGLRTTLMTCNAKSSAAKVADKVLAYRKIPEPYTYNVSTYLGMILSTTGEDPKRIKSFISGLDLPENFKDYESYTFVLQDKYLNICPMLDIKKSELFGPHLSMRAFSEGHARHAKFVNPWGKELVIGLSVDTTYYGLPKHRFNIELPKYASYGFVLALTYYLVGKIQQSKHQYFKENIENYCKDYGPKAYGSSKPFEVIVPGN